MKNESETYEEILLDFGALKKKGILKPRPAGKISKLRLWLAKLSSWLASTELETRSTEHGNVGSVGSYSSSHICGYGYQ